MTPPGVSIPIEWSKNGTTANRQAAFIWNTGVVAELGRRQENDGLAPIFEVPHHCTSSHIHGRVVSRDPTRTTGDELERTTIQRHRLHIVVVVEPIDLLIADHQLENGRNPADQLNRISARARRAPNGRRRTWRALRRPVEVDRVHCHRGPKNDGDQFLGAEPDSDSRSIPHQAQAGRDLCPRPSRRRPPRRPEQQSMAQWQSSLRTGQTRKKAGIPGPRQGTLARRSRNSQHHTADPCMCLSSNPPQVGRKASHQKRGGPRRGTWGRRPHKQGLPHGSHRPARTPHLGCIHSHRWCRWSCPQCQHRRLQRFQSEYSRRSLHLTPPSRRHHLRSLLRRPTPECSRRRPRRGDLRQRGSAPLASSHGFCGATMTREGSPSRSPGSIASCAGGTTEPLGSATKGPGSASPGRTWVRHTRASAQRTTNLWSGPAMKWLAERSSHQLGQRAHRECSKGEAMVSLGRDFQRYLGQATRDAGEGGLPTTRESLSRGGHAPWKGTGRGSEVPGTMRRPLYSGDHACAVGRLSYGRREPLPGRPGLSRARGRCCVPSRVPGSESPTKHLRKGSPRVSEEAPEHLLMAVSQGVGRLLPMARLPVVKATSFAAGCQLTFIERSRSPAPHRAPR